MTTQAEVLPRELRLGAPPTMPQARSYLFKQKSTLSDYPEKSVIQINIPRLQRSYLTNDSYLQFTVQMKATPGFVQSTTPTASIAGVYFANQAICCDTPGGYGFIDKIEVYDYLGSTLLESTSGHGQLMALLLDASSNSSQAKKQSVYAGTGKSQIGFNSDVAALGTSQSSNGVVKANTRFLNSTTQFGPLAGSPFQYQSYNRGIVTTATAVNSVPSNTEETITKEFNIPLLSFLGLLSPKYTPLHNGFTINITLNSRAVATGRYQMNATAAANQVVLGTITDFKINNVFFCAQVLELGPVAESMLLSSTQGNPLIVHSKAYRNFVTYLDSNTSNFRFDLNLNVASMTSILWIMRPTFNTAATSAEYCRTLSQRIRNFLTSWYFQYGSSILPQTTGIRSNITTTNAVSYGGGSSECFVELMKALRRFHGFAEETNFTESNYSVDIQEVASGFNSSTGAATTVTKFDRDYLKCPPYTLAPGTTLTPGGIDDAANPNAKVAAQSVDDIGRFACGLNLQLSPEHDFEVVSGLNTNGMNTSISGTFNPNFLSNQQQCQIDAWCEYDSFINITPGLASTVSF